MRKCMLKYLEQYLIVNGQYKNSNTFHCKTLHIKKSILEIAICQNTHAVD